MKFLKLLKMSWHVLWTSLLASVIVLPIGLLATPFLVLLMWWDEQQKTWAKIPSRKPDKFDEFVIYNKSIRNLVEECDVDVEVMKKPSIKVKGKKLNARWRRFAQSSTGILNLQSELREMRSWGLGRVYLYDWAYNDQGSVELRWAMHRDIGSKPSTRHTNTV